MKCLKAGEGWEGYFSPLIECKYKSDPNKIVSVEYKGYQCQESCDSSDCKEEVISFLNGLSYVLFNLTSLLLRYWPLHFVLMRRIHVMR